MSLLAKTSENFLDEKQEARLLGMVGALRADPRLLAQIAEIKIALDAEKLHDALALWDGLEEWEQNKVWLAPRFGGLFTTRQRQRLKERI